MGAIPLIRLIGTEICSYCGNDDECLQLPDSVAMTRAACLRCIQQAFSDYWDKDDDDTQQGANSK